MAGPDAIEVHAAGVIHQQAVAVEQDHAVGRHGVGHERAAGTDAQRRDQALRPHLPQHVQRSHGGPQAE